MSSGYVGAADPKTAPLSADGPEEPGKIESGIRAVYRQQFGVSHKAPQRHTSNVQALSLRHQAKSTSVAAILFSWIRGGPARRRAMGHWWVIALSMYLALHYS